MINRHLLRECMCYAVHICMWYERRMWIQLHTG